MEIPKFVEEDFQLDFKNRIHGGEGTIFIGNHSSYGKVAVKEWHRQYCDTKKEIVLKREIKILMENPHPQVIEVIGLLINKQSHCIGYVMPYMEIGSLEDGESYDDVKLSDFGIARSVADITGSLTKGIGTELYVALEMFKNENYTFSADIYSLSITIWEILHRRIPYDHIEYPSFAELYQMIISIGVRPQLKNDLPKEVSDLLKSCWDANVSKRPAIDKVLEFFENTAFSLSTSPVEKSNENFDTQPPIGKSSEKQTILLIGGIDGQNNDSLLMLENNEQNWKLSYIELLYGIRSHGAQFLNNNLYIFGGYNDGLGRLKWTYKLSESLKWKKMADMNQKRSRISNSSVTLNSQIWVCGGGNKKEELKSVEMYDPETNKWKYMKEMNEFRYNAATAVVSGKIFCSGGMFLNSVECYDPSSDVWTLICVMPEEIKEHCAIEMDGHFVVIEGTDKSKNIWALDTTDEDAEWIEKPSMSKARWGFSIAKINGKILVCGGNTEYGETDEVEIFDGEVWRNGPNMPAERSHAPAVVIPMSFARSLN